jgi:hypothetical protein
MKKTTRSIFAVLAALSLTMVLSAPKAQALAINFGSTPGATVQFNGTGDTFSFNNLPGGNSLSISTVNNGAGDSVGDLGFMTGSWNIGAITVVGGDQTAPVTGVGSLTIHGGGGFDLTATLTWDKIRSSGTGGIINVDGVVNLTGISYAGLQADLVALKNAGSAIEVVTFQFAPGKSLTDLTANGTTLATSFSGTIATVPDGGFTVAMLGFALTGLGLIRRKLGN